MAVIPLFRDTNMTVVTSRKNTSKATAARQSSKATKLHIWFVLNEAIHYCLLTRRTAFGGGFREKSCGWGRFGRQRRLFCRTNSWAFGRAGCGLHWGCGFSSVLIFHNNKCKLFNNYEVLIQPDHKSSYGGLERTRAQLETLRAQKRERTVNRKTAMSRFSIVKCWV